MGHFAKSRLSKCTYCWSATEGQSHQELLEFLMGYSRPLFHFIFGLFQTNMTFLQQYNVKQCLSRIWCWDSNPRPLVHESSHITTRPGLPPKIELMSFLLLEQDAHFLEWSRSPVWLDWILQLCYVAIIKQFTYLAESKPAKQVSRTVILTYENRAFNK